jgi:hypothetical protein
MTLRFTTWTSRAFTRLRAARRHSGILAVAGCAALLVAGTPRTALAVSTRDLIELSKAGLGDAVLVALIEADGTIFNLDAPKILELRAAGVSEAVITAMLRNATQAAPAPAPVEPQSAATPPAAPAEHDGAPYFVVIGEKPQAPAPEPTPTYIIPWIPWAGAQARPVRRAQPTMEYRGFGRFINDGWIDHSRR